MDEYSEEVAVCGCGAIITKYTKKSGRLDRVVHDHATNGKEEMKVQNHMHFTTTYFNWLQMLHDKMNRSLTE